MAQQQPNRRQLVKGGLALGALASFGTVAAGQESVEFSLPDPSEDLTLNAYNVEQINGYTKVTMDHLRDHEASSTLDVASIRLELDMLAGRNGTAKPVIITNYLDQGPEDRDPQAILLSQQQQDFYQTLIPDLIKVSQRPIILIEAIAISKDELDNPTGIHLGSLIEDLKSNTLGQSDTHLPIPEGQFITPYHQIAINGTPIYDGSFKQYPTDTPYQNILARESHNIGIMVIRSNETLFSE